MDSSGLPLGDQRDANASYPLRVDGDSFNANRDVYSADIDPAAAHFTGFSPPLTFQRLRDT